MFVVNCDSCCCTKILIILVESTTYSIAIVLYELKPALRC